MKEFVFQAIGTEWSILIDGKPLSDEEKEELLGVVDRFEKSYSRFLLESEANKYRTSEAGKFQVSKDFAVMLQSADILRKITGGVFDPAIGALLEHVGYDKEYSFIPSKNVEKYILPKWAINGNTLTIDAPIVFDIGGIGKGYCIDKVANFLKKCNRKHFLVEAGGDMYGTEKKDQSAFQIALEWPGKPGVAFGTIAIKHQGLAVSDSFRRRWQNWHHIVDPITKKPIEELIGCAAVAKNAFLADCMTSGIFLSGKEKYNKLAETFESEFVAFTKENKVIVSENWPGKFLQ